MSKDHRRKHLLQSFVLLLTAMGTIVTALACEKDTQRSPPNAADTLESVTTKSEDDIQGSVPNDLAIEWNWGNVFADLGRYSLTIKANGETELIRKGPAQKVTARRIFYLTPNELLDIHNEVVANKFFDLDKEYANRRVYDGHSSILSVSAGGNRHSVGVVNTSVKEIDQITAKIRSVLSVRYPHWDEFER